MNKLTIYTVMLILIIAGFFWFKNVNAPQNNNTPLASSPREATYDVEGKMISLSNGLSEIEIVPGSASKLITRYFGNETTGDFNEDGMLDNVFLITQESGGSGTFYYVVAALKMGSGYQGTNAILLGDRIAPQTTEFRNGEIIVNYADRKSNEPTTTQPSIGVSKYLKVIGNELVEIKK